MLEGNWGLNELEWQECVNLKASLCIQVQNPSINLIFSACTLHKQYKSKNNNNSQF